MMNFRFHVNSTLLDCKCDPQKLAINDKNDRFVVCSGKLYIDGLNFHSGNFLVELCEKYKIAYSHKVGKNSIDAKNAPLFYFLEFKERLFFR